MCFHVWRVERIENSLFDIFHPMHQHAIRAIFDEETIRVYQAYSPHIAHAALKAGRFVSPFKMERMTWIKPSFNWMMYRCGYGSKPGQEVVLGIDITREGFEWALRHAVLASFKPGIHPSYDSWKEEVATRPVRVQWDPERDWKIELVDNVRSIQIGLSGEAVQRYVRDWIVRIKDVTPLARVAQEASEMPVDLPCALERIYPVPADLEAICRE